MITTRIKFEAIKEKRKRIGKCSVCGKKMSQQKTFEHTINPFNKNEKGIPKTYSEVLRDVRAEADKWNPIFTHDRCK